MMEYQSNLEKLLLKVEIVEKKSLLKKTSLTKTQNEKKIETKFKFKNVTKDDLETFFCL